MTPMFDIHHDIGLAVRKAVMDDRYYLFRALRKKIRKGVLLPVYEAAVLLVRLNVADAISIDQRQRHG